MSFEIYKAVRPFAYAPGKTYYTTKLTQAGRMAIIRSSQKHDICKNVDEIKKKSNEWWPGSRWKNVIDTFNHYVAYDFDYERILCSDASAKKPSRSKRRKKSPVPSQSRMKQCKGKAPIGKICNPKTGRWVLRNGKIGRMIVARASYKSPNRRKSPRKTATAKRARGKRARGRKAHSPIRTMASSTAATPPVGMPSSS